MLKSRNQKSRKVHLKKLFIKSQNSLLLIFLHSSSCFLLFHDQSQIFIRLILVMLIFDISGCIYFTFLVLNCFILQFITFFMCCYFDYGFFKIPSFLTSPNLKHFLRLMLFSAFCYFSDIFLFSFFKLPRTHITFRVCHQSCQFKSFGTRSIFFQ